PRTDYMAMLDKRLKRMEDRVIRIIPPGQEAELNVVRSTVKPSMPGEMSAAKIKAQSLRKGSADEAFMPVVASATGVEQSLRPSTSKVGNGARQTENKLLLEGAEALPPQHIQEHLAEVFFDNIYGQSYLLLHKSSFMRKLKARTAPPVLTLAICAVSARFSSHPQVGTEPAFLRGEEWANAARQIAERRHFEPNITIVTVLIILGLHYFGTCEGGLSWSFGGMAVRMAYALQLHKELDHVPLGQAQVGKAKLAGATESKVPVVSFTDREIRRRLMWSCVFMDTFNSSGTERPAMISEEDMQIQLPIKESSFQMEVSGVTERLDGEVLALRGSSSDQDLRVQAKANMGVAAYLVRAVVLWKNTIRHLNLGGKEKDPHPIWDSASRFATLVRQVAELKVSLPDSLKYKKTNLEAHATEGLANQLLFMHITIAQCNLFLHRFAIPVAPNTRRAYPPGTPKEFLAAAATTVIDAASSISRIIAQSTGHNVNAPFTSYAVYSSSTVHIWGIFSKNSMLEQTSRELLRENFKYLNHIKRHWGMVHYMVESVRETFARFANAAKTEARKANELRLDSESTTPRTQTAPASPISRTMSPAPMGSASGSKTKDASSSKMLQYGDWFDKYPRGLGQSEWQSRNFQSQTREPDEEAVLSQPSELQSVEEFFAALAPPSKAVQHEGLGRGRGLARKRARTSTDRQKDAQAQLNAQQQTRTESLPQQDVQLPAAAVHRGHEIDAPISGVHPYMRQQIFAEPQQSNTPSSTMSPGSNVPHSAIPSISSSGRPGNSNFAQARHHPNFEFDVMNSDMNINSNAQYHYTSTLPQVDRQM
ncbi:hypothetical protein LTR66_015098, partial [Elasticomyces elasticus]